MLCSKCNSKNVSVQTSTYMQSKSRSCLWNLLLLALTCGFWIVWMLIRKRKEKKVTETIATCQSCGHSWKI